MIEQRTLLAFFFGSGFRRILPALFCVTRTEVFVVFNPSVRWDVRVVVLVDNQVFVEAIDHAVDELFPFWIAGVLVPGDHGTQHTALTVNIGVLVVLHGTEPGLLRLLGTQ